MKMTDEGTMKAIMEILSESLSAQIPDQIRVLSGLQRAAKVWALILGHLPAHEVQKATVEYIQESPFWPTPADIAKRCPTDAQRRADKAQKEGVQAARQSDTGAMWWPMLLQHGGSIGAGHPDWKDRLLATPERTMGRPLPQGTRTPLVETLPRICPTAPRSRPPPAPASAAPPGPAPR